MMKKSDIIKQLTVHMANKDSCRTDSECEHLYRLYHGKSDDDEVEAEDIEIWVEDFANGGA